MRAAFNRVRPRRHYDRSFKQSTYQEDRNNPRTQKFLLDSIIIVERFQNEGQAE